MVIFVLMKVLHTFLIKALEFNIRNTHTDLSFLESA